MNIIQRYLLQLFFPVFIVALLFFILLLELGDLFANLAQYLQNGVGFLTLLRVMYLYLPKCISFAMPLSVLFAGSYTMGNMYAKNELTSVFASGVPLAVLVTPLVFCGFLLSVGMFYFEDTILIHFQRRKIELVNHLLEPEQNLNSSDIVILSDSGKTVYFADFYDHDRKELTDILIVLRTESGKLRGAVKGSTAQWHNGHWELYEKSVYMFEEDGSVGYSEIIDQTVFTEPPETFQKNISSVDQMTISQARLFIENLKKLGLPYHEHLSQYYRRFSFPFTIFIVLFFSVAAGGRFKKNILLMSLLFSLSLATLYYVTEMMTMLFAKWEYISPLAGASLPFLIFTALSFGMLKIART
ncbi:MAG: LptF/LptG family permease [Treponema sp.]